MPRPGAGHRRSRRHRDPDPFAYTDLGVSYGAYAMLESLGFAFLHPLAPTDVPGLGAVTECLTAPAIEPPVPPPGLGH